MNNPEKSLDYNVRAISMRNALEKKPGFKGQGILNGVSDSSLEYYNSGIDQILALRLGNICYDRRVIILKSQYFGEGSTAARLVDNVAVRLAGGEIKTILAPVNLYNKHWLGLLFNTVGKVVEVTYMDSEQTRPVPQLKEGLETGLAVTGYERKFVEARLEKQRYSNCGLEAIENFVYYLTGTRATQEASVYVHSLLVENSLLDSEEYRLKIEENNKFIGFLSNAAPLPIRSMDITFLSSGLIKGSLTASGHHRVKHEYNTGVLGADRQATLNILPAVEQFNKLAAQLVHNKLQQINVGIYKTTLGFKGLDLAVDFARFMYDPEFDNAKKVVLDAAQLYAMAKEVNGYSALVNIAEVSYQLHLGEYQKARDAAADTVSAMALPIILAYANKPYLGFVYNPSYGLEK